MGKEFTNLTEADLCDLMCGDPEPEYDQMSMEEAIQTLEYQYENGQMEQYVHEALGIAVRSLEAWAKVRKEICAQMERYSVGRNEFRDGVMLGLGYAMTSIDEHLEEIQ